MSHYIYMHSYKQRMQYMNNEDFNEQHEQAEQSIDRNASLSRRIRLVGRLMRADLQKTLRSEHPPTRGEVKAAMRAIESRATAAVSAEDLATTLATLDKIAEAFGGRDALPFRPHGRGRGFGHGFEHGGRGFGPHRHGRSHGFALHH